MARVPYEIVAIEASRIIIKMAACSSWDQAFDYWDQYQAYIEVCGWTDWEFDLETIRRIDAAWETVKIQRIWN